jgi:predicted chitinase
LTKRINGGTNGLQDRIKYTTKFGKILGVIWNAKK